MIDFVRSDQEITPPLFSLLAWLAVKLGDATDPDPPAVADRRHRADPADLAARFADGRSQRRRSSGPRSRRSARSSPSTPSRHAPIRSRWRWWPRPPSSCCSRSSGARPRGGPPTRPSPGRRCTPTTRPLSPSSHSSSGSSGAVPEARVPALLANVAAAIAYLPWVPSLLDDVSSPSQDIIGSLAPFNFDNLTAFTGSWSIGHPARSLDAFWGTGLEIALFAGIALGVVGAAIALESAPRDDRSGSRRGHGRDALLLIAMLAFACPAGAALVSLLAADQYLPRNLAVSWPAFSLLLAAILTAGPRSVRFAASAASSSPSSRSVPCRTTEPEWGRPDVGGAAAFIEAHTGPGRRHPRHALSRRRQRAPDRRDPGSRDGRAVREGHRRRAVRRRGGRRSRRRGKGRRRRPAVPRRRRCASHRVWRA